MVAVGFFSIRGSYVKIMKYCAILTILLVTFPLTWSMHRVAIIVAHIRETPQSLKIKEDSVLLGAVKSPYNEQGLIDYEHISFALELTKPEDVNEKDAHGCTPLAYAVYMKDEKLIKMLEAAGGTYKQVMLKIIKHQEDRSRLVFSQGNLK